MWFLLLLLAITNLAIGCVPVKTPSPGIPAIPGCDVLDEIAPAECVATLGRQCGQVTRTSTMISCPDPAFPAPFIRGSDGNNDIADTGFKCDPATKQWNGVNADGSPTPVSDVIPPPYTTGCF